MQSSGKKQHETSIGQLDGLRHRWREKHPHWETTLRIPEPALFTIMVNRRVSVQMQLGGIELRAMVDVNLHTCNTANLRETRRGKYHLYSLNKPSSPCDTS